MELLAPAGDIASLQCAVANGADAVYLGLGELNARVKATGFDVDNLQQWVAYCHLYGVKVYVTVNTVVYNHEIERAQKLLDCIAQSGADAVIATDIAVVDYALSIGLPVHISTQAGVHTVDGAAFWQERGARRVVLSREYSLDDLRRIAQLGIETEVFVHGALCVAFSGGCLLSSHIGGQSGNRGRCKQPCRQWYEAYEDGKRLGGGYLLSTADLCCDESLSALQQAGVTSLKIEGRLKRPEYVAVVTRYYRQLLDGKQPDKTELFKIYNRGGFCMGYDAPQPVIYPLTPSHIGLRIGTIRRVDITGTSRTAWIQSSHPLVKGDGLKILRRGQEVGGALVGAVTTRCGEYGVSVTGNVAAGDGVCLTTDAGQIASVKSYPDSIPCRLQVAISLGQPSVATASVGAVNITVSGDMAKEGRTMAMEELETQLRKTGQTPFVVSSLQVRYDGGYLPKSALNALRNNAMAALQQALQSLQPARGPIVLPPTVVASPLYYRTVVEVDEIGKLNELSADAVVLAPWTLDVVTLQAMADRVSGKIPVFVKIPRLQRREQYADILQYVRQQGFGVCCDNVATVHWARQNGVPYIAGLGLNCTNDYTARAYADAVCVVASVERPDRNVNPYGTSTYCGKLPLMTLAHCPYQVLTGKGCKQCRRQSVALQYRSKGWRFDIYRIGHRQCVFVMYSQRAVGGVATNGCRYLSLIGYADVSQMLADMDTSHRSVE